MFGESIKVFHISIKKALSIHKNFKNDKGTLTASCLNHLSSLNPPPFFSVYPLDPRRIYVSLQIIYPSQMPKVRCISLTKKMHEKVSIIVSSYGK